MFKKIAQMIKQGKRKETLKLIHESIDERRGYGSETNSVYAEESLNLVIKEEFNKGDGHVWNNKKNKANV